jgi:hypothetical protein
VSVHVRIVGHDLPGMRFAPAPASPTGERVNVHVGVQRGREVEQLARGDAAVAEFDFDVDVRAGRFSGPYVHGRNGDRFVYLSWGAVDGDEFTMFRRAKLRLEHLDAGALDGRALLGELALGGDGGPLCASVRPPQIRWTVV